MRGLHVPILYGLLEAASFYNATDTYDPVLGKWIICFDYRWWIEDFAIERHWCTEADFPVAPPDPPPPPPTHSFSGCPGDHWPDVITMQMNTVIAGVYPCITAVTFDVTFDITLGPWGGWRGVLTSCPGITYTLEVFPTATVTGGMTWEWHFTGGGNANVTFANIPCGTLSLSGPTWRIKAPGVGSIFVYPTQVYP